MPISKTDSKQDVAEAQLEYQQELEQLQRQYRKMKNEKKSFKVETDNILLRQESEIAKLCEEHEEMEALLQVAFGKYNQDFDLGNVKMLNTLLDKDQFVQDVLKQDKLAVVTLNKQLVTTKENIFEKRRTENLSPVNNGSADHFKVQRQIRILENRVYNANIRFNRTLTKNSKLKSTIDYITCQKTRFRELHKKLSNVLAHGKTEIDSVVESSLNYFHTRDEAQHRMTFLKEKAERDLSLYNMELKDVMRVIDHDRKLRNFMNTKTEDRSDILEKAIFKRQNKRLCNLLSTLKVEATKYEEIFSKIKEVTGIEDNDELVTQFIRIEDENFALFNYINQIDTEIESLQEEIKERQKDMADIKRNCTQIDKRRKEILRELEVRFSKVTENRQQTQERYKKAKAVLEHVKPKVEYVFKLTKCNRAAITDLLGNTSGLTDDNVMAYMGIIEQRTNELLQVYFIQKLKFGVTLEDTNKQVADAIFPPAASSTHRLSIKPPVIADELDSQQSGLQGDAHPLTFKEAQALVMKGLTIFRNINNKETKKMAPV